MKNYYEELTALKAIYPELTFDSEGYQEIPDAVKEANREGIQKIEALLKEAVPSFVRFQNFKPRKDGTAAVRCQTRWDERFTGVNYFPLADFKPDSPTWDAEEVTS